MDELLKFIEDKMKKSLDNPCPNASQVLEQNLFYSNNNGNEQQVSQQSVQTPQGGMQSTNVDTPQGGFQVDQILNPRQKMPNATPSKNPREK